MDTTQSGTSYSCNSLIIPIHKCWMDKAEEQIFQRPTITNPALPQEMNPLQSSLGFVFVDQNHDRTFNKKTIRTSWPYCPDYTNPRNPTCPLMILLSMMLFREESNATVLVLTVDILDSF